MTKDPRILDRATADAIIARVRKATAELVIEGNSPHGCNAMLALLDHAEALTAQADADRRLIEAAERLVEAKRAGDKMFAGRELHETAELIENDPGVRSTALGLSEAGYELECAVDERAGRTS